MRKGALYYHLCPQDDKTCHPSKPCITLGKKVSTNPCRMRRLCKEWELAVNKQVRSDCVTFRIFIFTILYSVASCREKSVLGQGNPEKPSLDDILEV